MRAEATTQEELATGVAFFGFGIGGLDLADDDGGDDA